MPVNGAVKTSIARCWRLLQRLRPGPPALTILYYHAVPAADAANFDQQMAWLATHANVVFADHEGPLDPSRPNVAITFDDAFESVSACGLSALERHGIGATIFVPSAWLGHSPGWQMETDADRSERVMAAEALRALPRNIFRFGSHSVDHPRMSRLDPVGRRAQFVESRTVLEAELGAPIETLAFPYGDHDQALVKLARTLGYRYVFSILPEAVRPEAKAICRGRTAADAADPLDLFVLKAQGAFTWLPFAIKAKGALRGKRSR